MTNARIADVTQKFLQIRTKERLWTMMMFSVVGAGYRALSMLIATISLMCHGTMALIANAIGAIRIRQIDDVYPLLRHSVRICGVFW